jgi:hypothetical protein
MLAARAILTLVLALSAAAPAAARKPAPTPDWTSRAVAYLLDTCPRVLAGEVRLDDLAAVRALGLEPMTPRSVGKFRVQALDSRKPQPITLGFDDGPDKRGCRVSFDDDARMGFTRALHAGLATRGWTSAGSSLPGFVNFYTPPSPAVTDVLMLVAFPKGKQVEPWSAFTMIRKKPKAN